MYLDSFFGEHTGHLTLIDRYTSSNGSSYIRFWIEFKDGYNADPGVLFHDQIVIQEAHPLGQRLNKTGLFQLTNCILRIRRSDDVFLFYHQDPGIEGDGELVALITQSPTWRQNEGDYLWHFYKTENYSTQKLSTVFGRSIEDIELEINLLSTEKETLKGIDHYIEMPDDNGGHFIIIILSHRDVTLYPEHPNVNIECNSSILELLKKVNFEEGKSLLWEQSEDGISRMIIRPGMITKTQIPESISRGINAIAGMLPEEITKYVSSQTRNLFFQLSSVDLDDDSDNECGYLIVSNSEESLLSFRDHFKKQASGFKRYLLYRNYLQLRKDLANRTAQLNNKIQEVVNQSLIAALSSIMARNMSHNLGSHFLEYTKTDVEQWADIFANQDDTKDYSPYMRGAANVLEYIKERMNHLSTIISDDWLPYFPVNFKSQVLSELLIDDFSRQSYQEESNYYKRTANYYLSNLVRSEGYKRPDILSDKTSNKGNLTIQVLHWAGDHYEGGLHSLPEIRIALPGGPIAKHAIFNILENFIRNSAKYNWIAPVPNLVITIAVKVFEDEGFMQLTVFDNKSDANKKRGDKCLFDVLERQLFNLVFINEDNSVNTDNKGIKEMLLSALWINTNEAEKRSLSDIVWSYSNCNYEERANLLERFGIRFKRLTENGEDTSPDNDNANLGISLRLPLFTTITEFNSISDLDGLSTHHSFKSDIALINFQVNDNQKHYLKSIFPRIVFSPFVDYKLDGNLQIIKEFVEETPEEGQESFNAVRVLISSMNDRFGDISSYRVKFGERREPNCTNLEPKDTIFFDKHQNINGLSNILSSCDRYAYVDSISGDDYTTVLRDYFENGLHGKRRAIKFATWNDKYHCLRVLESALTRITIVDERIFDLIRWVGRNDSGPMKGTQYELSFKNVRILKYCEKEIDTQFAEKVEGFDILRGNSFRPINGAEKTTNFTHMLFLHLSTLETMLKNSIYLEDKCGKRIAGKELSEDRVKRLIELLRNVFSPEHPEDLRIFIHSDRGNQDRLMETALKDYRPLIPFSVLKELFVNSKYLLSQICFSPYLYRNPPKF